MLHTCLAACFGEGVVGADLPAKQASRQHEKSTVLPRLATEAYLGLTRHSVMAVTPFLRSHRATPGTGMHACTAWISVLGHSHAPLDRCRARS